MKRVILSVAMVATGLVLVSGCCPFSACDKSAPVAEAPVKKLCKGCGQVKGSDLCCKPGAKKCGKCGKAKGAPGCCA